MNKPLLVSYAEKSVEQNPGHLVIGQEGGGTAPSHYGYRFDPADLPESHCKSEMWRNYLFTNYVPGYIVNESKYVHLLLSQRARLAYVKRSETEKPLSEVMPVQGADEAFGSYSFNPDDFGTVACYNCVSWGVSIANLAVPDFLQPVRQGRIKLIVEQMTLLNSVAESPL